MDNPAAWHPDPAGKHDHRWWDGQRWTEHVADAGVASVDPLPAAPDAADDATSSTDTPGDASDAAGTAGATPTTQQPTWGQQPQQDPAGSWQGQQHGQAPWQSQQPHGQQPWSGAPTAATPWNQDPVWGAGDGQPPASNGLAIGSLVTGILSLPLLFAFGLGGLLGIVAVVLGILAVRRANRGDGTGRGMAIGGIVTGAISIIFAIFIVLFLFAFGTGVIDEMNACMDETGGDTQECQRRLERELTERFTS